MKTTSCKMKRYVNSKSKYGKDYIREVDSQAKIKALLVIHNNHFHEEFTIEDFLNSSLRYERSDKNKIAREKQRLLRLRRQNWIRKNKGGFFEITNKFKHYLKKWGTFDNPESPLIKKRQPRIIERVIEKEVPIEVLTKTTIKDKFLEEI